MSNGTSETQAVVEVLLEGRDFLANAINYYEAVNPTLIHDGDREMCAALTQAASLLLGKG